MKQTNKIADPSWIDIQDRDKRIAELVGALGEMTTRRNLAENEVRRLQAESECLRRPACSTEQSWLDQIRRNDEQALLWFRAMLRESALKKEAMEDAERYRLARKFEFLTDRQLLSIDAAMERK